MRRLLVTVVLAGAALTLAGCGIRMPAPNADLAAPERIQSYGPDQSGEFFVKEVMLPDGQHVICVVYANRTMGGLSCNWPDARR